MKNKRMTLVEAPYVKKEVPQFRIGDQVDVHQKILEGEKERIQIFSGLVIARKGDGTREMFTVRRTVHGEGVERTFPLHSPKIATIEVIRSGKVRRAKLYYLRDRVGKATRLRERKTKLKIEVPTSPAAPAAPPEPYVPPTLDLSQPEPAPPLPEPPYVPAIPYAPAEPSPPLSPTPPPLALPPEPAVTQPTVPPTSPERRVDVSMQRFNADGADGSFIKKRNMLGHNTRYRLRVHIGAPTKESLVVDGIPPLDKVLPLLAPDENGHVLHVAVYGLDFAVEEPAFERVILPLEGGSQPVFFYVRTPVTLGPARLRISVYYDLAPDQAHAQESRYRNYLLQSLLLEARVAETEGDGVEGSTRVRLEFSRSRRLDDLDRIGRRLLSLSMNAGQDGKTHTLTFKSGTTSGYYRLLPEALSPVLDGARDLLNKATEKEGGNRFSAGKVVPPEEKKLRQQLFDDSLREIARQGAKLYDTICLQSETKFLKELKLVRAANDGIIQVVRYDQSFLLPWAMLYDFNLPAKITGQPDTEVCHGFLREVKGRPISCHECLADCHFQDKSKTYCVYGFWGFRHQLEQPLFSPNENQNRIHSVTPRRPAGLLIAVDQEAGPARDMLADMAQQVPAFARPLRPQENIVELLWNDATRPWLLLLLSHHAYANKDGEPEGERLSLPGGGWFLLQDLIDKIKDAPDPWGQPQPIVLLAACGSVAEDVKTLVGFLSAFTKANAAAVVGTETVVYEGLAARFGKEVALALLQNQKLGVALLEFRRALLRENNPLGLVFTPYGEADLLLEDSPQPVPARN